MEFNYECAQVEKLEPKKQPLNVSQLSITKSNSFFVV